MRNQQALFQESQNISIPMELLLAPTRLRLSPTESSWLNYLLAGALGGSNRSEELGVLVNEAVHDLIAITGSPRQVLRREFNRLVDRDIATLSESNTIGINLDFTKWRTRDEAEGDLSPSPDDLQAIFDLAARREPSVPGFQRVRMRNANQQFLRNAARDHASVSRSQRSQEEPATRDSTSSMPERMRSTEQLQGFKRAATTEPRTPRKVQQSSPAEPKRSITAEARESRLHAAPASANPEPQAKRSVRHAAIHQHEPVKTSANVNSSLPPIDSRLYSRAAKSVVRTLLRQSRLPFIPDGADELDHFITKELKSPIETLESWERFIFRLAVATLDKIEPTSAPNFESWWRSQTNIFDFEELHKRHQLPGVPQGSAGVEAETTRGRNLIISRAKDLQRELAQCALS